MGQTPPPWHGQAVATQILFDHDWPDFDVDFIRMDYSEDMDEVGRFHIRKLWRLFRLIRETRRVLSAKPGSTLLYPPASAKWIPFLRDVVFLAAVRPKAAQTIFIFHASGLAAFTRENALSNRLAEIAYGGADMALEVAEEKVSPHEVFNAKGHLWCPCGIEAPPMERPPRTPGEPTKVLFVGSLQEGKGVLEILKTADVLRKSGHGERFRFDIVGRWMNDDFKRQAMDLHRRLELGDSVRFPGQLTGGEKWRAYHEADVFFFPSHYISEASPLVLMEALAAGLPIITTAWNGIPALMRGCPTATLLPIKSPEAFADALQKLALDPHAADEIAAKSRRFYEENFLPERFVERVTGAIRTVTAAPTEPHMPDAPAPARKSPLRISAYLADQNPGNDRSMGISRMSEVILEAIARRENVDLHVVVSKSSQNGPDHGTARSVFPWGTRNPLMRIVTDQLHPIFSMWWKPSDIWYYPKGFLPYFGAASAPCAVTVHDTIIQYYWDHYPGWRRKYEYNYWAQILKHTLRKADVVFTVSENSKAQIESFMERHGIPNKEILVTYEPCVYEKFPQPESPEKDAYVIHLASREPHKRTEDLIRWWEERAQTKQDLPVLCLVGKIPKSCVSIVSGSTCFKTLPFLEDSDLMKFISRARALIMPSEVEGFGLPAIEAYYLGTPVCYTLGTSVEEILAGIAPKGGFDLAQPSSLWPALDEVLAMPAAEIRRAGLALREKFASEKIVGRILGGLHEVAASRREDS
jgi:glycosyltransferase involved in cell wall biosynthesis